MSHQPRPDIRDDVTLPGEAGVGPDSGLRGPPPAHAEERLRSGVEAEAG